jgi:hypothetical protein
MKNDPRSAGSVWSEAVTVLSTRAGVAPRRWIVSPPFSMPALPKSRRKALGRQNPTPQFHIPASPRTSVSKPSWTNARRVNAEVVMVSTTHVQSTSTQPRARRP